MTLASDVQGAPDRASSRSNEGSVGWRLTGIAVVGVAIALSGLALVASVPFDGPARIAVGASLLTGVLVGAALIGIEYALDQRRVAREAALREQLFHLIGEAADDSLATFVAAHFESAWGWFGSLVPDVVGGDEVAIDDMPALARPSGWIWPQDARDLRMSLMWRIEEMADDRSWWRSPEDLAATDAIFFAVTDIAERFGLGLDAADDARLHGAGTATLRRLMGIAQRLSEAGDPIGASRIDQQVNAISFRDTPSYAPRLPGWGDETYDYIIPNEENPLRTLRRELAWITAELRTSKVRVDRFGDSLEAAAPSPAEFRWGALLGPSDSAEEMWDRRFEQGSWFRRLISQAAEDLRRTRLGRIASIEAPLPSD